MLLRRAGRVGLVTGTLGLGGYSMSSAERRRKTLATGSACMRMLNLFSTSCMIASDYAYALYVAERGTDNRRNVLVGELEALQSTSESLIVECLKQENRASKIYLRERINATQVAIKEKAEELGDLSPSEKSSSLSTVHKRSAERLRDLCMRNRGIYIKLGQHLCQMDYLLPDEYIHGLEPLLSQNPEPSWDSIERVVAEDLGKAPEELFEFVERAPIASASLAQVHVAYGHDGKKYALKVQHEGLLEGSNADRAAITFVIDQISYLFKGFSYKWLTREMNKNLPLELDFEHEAANLSRCRALFEGDDRVAFPDVREDMTSKRVLCMSFEEGVYVSDFRGMKELGVDLADVARTVSSVFCEQIFRHGFVHCDPHQHNLLVRKHPFLGSKGRAQIVLLDHGLYRNLSEEFRMNYCRLWRGILLGDESEIKKYCTKLNAGHLYSLLAAVLTMKPWNDIVSKDMGRLQSTGSNGEMEMLQAYAKRYLFDIVRLLGVVPSELLLLLKTNDCLRHIDVALGVPVNTATIVASTTARVVLSEDIQDCKSLTGTLSALLLYVKLELRVVALRIIEMLPALSAFLTGKH